MTHTTPQVAQMTRQTIRTIRHWESLGLLGNVRRDKRGDRVFTDAQLQRAKIVSAASMAGMGLDEIKVAHEQTLREHIREAVIFMRSVYEVSFDL